MIFYDPHPGVGGAAAPLPHVVQTAARALDGKAMTVDAAITALKTAVATLKQALPGSKVEDIGGAITLKMHGASGSTHCWCVIRYREQGR